MKRKHSKDIKGSKKENYLAEEQFDKKNQCHIKEIEKYGVTFGTVVESDDDNSNPFTALTDTPDMFFGIICATLAQENPGKLLGLIAVALKQIKDIGMEEKEIFYILKDTMQKIEKEKSNRDNLSN